MVARKFFVGGNFKMNGSLKEIETIIERINEAKFDGEVELVVAPPALYLLKIQEELKPPAQVSAQNSYTEKSGAFTGEISPNQLKDANVHWVILGHSERRSLFGDTDKLVADKTKAAVEAGLGVIACIGESLQEREADQTQAVVERQLEAIANEISESEWKDIVIAYEPVWAIGTGKVASKEQAQEVHANIRQWLAKKVSQTVADQTRIIYGGSVNGKNSGDLATAADIDGFLVGGASLKPEFIDIVNSGKA
ncbi:triose-phosphate isomerase [Kwoniella pini CBS 10737]|uniref:Triosephosphate isomerase n=1 Tax=Kwoniella pini CBS 10737 TaxID=1296096 RepID=A0A1B9I3J8_9TREE|nr:triose-phosphate isomerase [Kwoniella pini CBS 10737]OCF50102.1 triose-phosphate isomerase [Kwoniella pini CBS 10737]